MRHALLPLLSAALLTGLHYGPSEIRSSNDEAGIRQAVEYYGEGLRMGDVELFRRAFHPEAVWAGYIGAELVIESIEGMYERVQVTPTGPAETD
jgi:hypothetical protein